MDGVLIHSEPVWETLEREYLPKVFGAEIAARMGSLVGLGIVDVVERAQALGSSVGLTEYMPIALEMAIHVYESAPITDRIEVLVAHLTSNDFRLGIVSQSPEEWISRVVPRLSFRDQLDIIVSLQGHSELKRKPSPDGYTYVMRALTVPADNAFVLEDSNVGIAAGKASGAFTIGYRGNLLPGYEQTGADAYADTMDDVIKLVESFDGH